MKNTIIFFIIGAVVALMGYTGFVMVTNPNSSARISTKSAAAKRVQVSQTITFSPSSKKNSDEVIMETGKTALDLLHKTAIIKTQGDGANAFVTQIDGMLADMNKKEFWAFYVNGTQADVGAGSYILRNGDKIEWKREMFDGEIQIK